MMKLYVWVDPYQVSYGSSLVFAIAEDLDAAKEQARTGTAFAYGKYSEPTPSNVILGDPDRIVDLPCAEWHMWSE